MRSLSWVTVVWSMVSSACLTLAAMHGLVWWKRRTAWADLLFSLTAASAAAYTLCELWAMRAITPEEVGTAIRWAHVPLWVVLLSLAGFVRLYLRAGWAPLAWSFVGLRTASLLLDFLTGQNLNYRVITAVKRIPFLGESVSLPVGEPNPWMVVGQLSSLALILFVADASFTVWRRGDRRKAVLLGGSIVFFVLGGQVQSMLVFWQVVEAPITVGIFYLGIIAAMGYELSRDVFRASQLVVELQTSEAGLRDSEQRFRLMADTAPVMIWLAGSDGRYRFFNKPWLEFRGRTVEEEADDGWTEGIHPEDATRCRHTYAQAFAAREPFHREYRFKRFDGEYCWMRDTGVPRVALDGTLLGYIGSCIEITDIKRTERELREHQATLEASNRQISDLFGRLIAAQETERTRIARDLHDDVSQRIAGLAIMISGVKRRFRGEPAEADVMGALTSMQQSTVALAEQIRHFSHELHPILLQHTGLDAALSMFCAEFEKLYAITVTCTADVEAERIEADTALCLYRIAQEALRNVAKHADARHVSVTLTHTTDGVELSIVDDGKGFDIAGARGTGAGLGLVSIDERARLLRGSIRIDTQPQHGTRLHVQIPWPHEIGR